MKPGRPQPDRRFRIRLEWDVDEPPSRLADPDEATWGWLSVCVGGESIWFAPDAKRAGFHWTWIELLEYLGEAWPWLVYEHGLPRAAVSALEGRVNQTTLEALRAVASTCDPLTETREYARRHDLAFSINGAILPPLWVVRDGNTMWLFTQNRFDRLPFNEVIAQLREVGDHIAKRLEPLSDPRAQEACEDWSTQRRPRVEDVVSIATGLDVTEIGKLAGSNIRSKFELPPGEVPLAMNELLAAARMATPVANTSVIGTLLSILKGVSHRATPALDKIANQAEERFGSPTSLEEATRQGQELASWFREYLTLSDEEDVDPGALLGDWDVETMARDLGTPTIDAVACWGPQHGPAVIVNPSGAHSQTPPGERASFAHEIAHLLVDRGEALAVAEVLGGQAPRALERRANAFSAELLMPRRVAGKAFRYSEEEPSAIIKVLARKYRVSHEIIAWQAYNSGFRMRWETFLFLRSKVSHPERFVWSRVAVGM